MQEISKKLLVVNIIISHVIILSISLILIKLLNIQVSMSAFLTFPLTLPLVISVIMGIVLLVAVQLIFIRLVPKEKLIDEINMILMEKFSLPELLPIFLVGALVEELLFRVIIQPYLGIILTSILFSLIHFRYLKKPIVMIEVFILGVILGAVYTAAPTLWAPLLCHFGVNYIMAVLIKKEIIHYQ